MARVPHLLLPLVLAALVACDAFASAAGRVVDRWHRPVAGAKVTLGWGNQLETVLSDSLGRFAVSFAHGSGREATRLWACKPAVGSAAISFVAGDTSLRQIELILASTVPDSLVRCP